MKLIPLRKKKGNPEFALVDDTQYPVLNKYNWYSDISKKNGFAYARTRDAAKAHIKNNDYTYMHNLIARPGENQYVVHLDGKTLNNQHYNLKLKDVKPCIFENKRCKKRPFQVYYKKKYLGNFATESEAEKAVKKFTEKL